MNDKMNLEQDLDCLLNIMVYDPGTLNNNL